MAVGWGGITAFCHRLLAEPLKTFGQSIQGKKQAKDGDGEGNPAVGGEGARHTLRRERFSGERGHVWILAGRKISAVLRARMEVGCNT